MEKSVKARTIIASLSVFCSIIVSTSASALVQFNPNSIYMIGASVNVQLYNKRILGNTTDTNPYNDFPPNVGVIDKNNPLYFSSTVSNKKKIFWGQIPNNYDLYFIPAMKNTSNITGMMTPYNNLVPGSPFAPLIPAYVLVGWVGSMCEDPDHDEGLEEIKSQTRDLILNAHPLTKIVLMKYPTEGLSFNCSGNYFANARNYNAYIETLRLWFASVSVIDPWKSYSTSTKYPKDKVHADDSTLESAAIRIRECFENGLPLSCKNKP